jgi:riboflavin synthase
MFTGLVTEIGTIAQVREIPAGRLFRVRAPETARGMKPGDSVAVNGTCLTAESFPSPDVLEATAGGETLRRTTLGSLRLGSRVHLEPALRLGDRMGGHWVNGHVDVVAAVLSVRRLGNDACVELELPGALAPYVVEKGSIAVDGVSLTVGAVTARGFEVHIIPATEARTLFAEYRPGTRVNLEADIMAKYVERVLLVREGGARAAATLAAWVGEEEGSHDGRD